MASIDKLSLIPAAMIAAAAALMTTTLSAAPQKHSLESLLETTLTPGTVGLLIPYAAELRAQDRMLDGLGHQSSQVRAISARVIGLTKVTRLSDSVRAALATETDLFAGREQMRALAILDGSAATEPILKASARMGGEMWQVAAETLVLQDGFRALRAHLPEFCATLDDGGLQWLIAGAMQRPTDPVEMFATDILAAGNRRAWHDLLTVLADKRRSIDPAILLSALGDPSWEISGETAWHLTVMFRESAPRETQPWVDALQNRTPGPSTSPDHLDLAFGLDLLGRTLGHAAETNGPWIDYLGGETRSHVDLLNMDAIIAPRLTPQEIKAVTQRFQRLFKEKRFNDKRVEPIERRLDNRVVRTVGGFPKGFVKDLLQVTGCVMPKQPEGVVQADVTYDSAGRPRKVVLVTEPESDECKEFVTTLFTASSTPPQHVPDPTLPERLLLFLEKSPVARLEDELFSYWPLAQSDGTEIAPPKRTVMVAPRYPRANRERRQKGRVVLGLVVNRDGNVRDLRMLHTSHDGFVLSAMRAVQGWQYAPAVSEGRPVAVRLTVIVEYNLRP